MTDTKSDYLQDAIRNAYNLHRKRCKAGDTARLFCAFCECEGEVYAQAKAHAEQEYTNGYLAGQVMR